MSTRQPEEISPSPKTSRLWKGKHPTSPLRDRLTTNLHQQMPIGHRPMG